MKSKALLFGLNYRHAKSGQLNGCINDVHNMKQYLTQKYSIPCSVYTDDVDLVSTSKAGIVAKMLELTRESYLQDLDFVWIHYSGHGTQFDCNPFSARENDGKDEALVPSDYEVNGCIKDNTIQRILQQFNPKTKVVCVFDCCHSATICDMRYSWGKPNSAEVENKRCQVKSKVISISGCLDSQVSMDAFNVRGDFKSTGALTSCLLECLNDPKCTENVFLLVERLNATLKAKGFEQIPLLCSSFNLKEDPSLVPSQVSEGGPSEMQLIE
jgi:hypothetical protein